MLVIAFFAQNLVPGMVFGSFGALILASEDHLHTTRAIASLGLGMVLLTTSLFAPVASWLIGRTSIRFTMLLGATASGLGYLALAFADSAVLMLAANALLIGPGLSLCGVMPSNALVCNWFIKGQGRALGIVNMPLAVMIVPLVCVALLQSIGLRWTYICLALAYLPLLAMIFFVVDTPSGDEEVAYNPLARTSPAQLITNPAFWLLVVASSLIVAGAITKAAHLAPLMVERGFPIERAAIILSIAGGMGVLGSPTFGWIAEKWGGGVALAISALLQGAAWVLLLVANSFTLLVVVAAIVGACAGGYMVSTAVVIASLYGPRQFPKVYAMLSPLTLPILFGAAPFAGYLRDLTGSYTIAFVVHIIGFAFAGVMAVLLIRRERGARPALLAAA